MCLSVSAVDVLAEGTAAYLVEGIVGLLVGLTVTLVDSLGQYQIYLGQTDNLTVHGAVGSAGLG